MDKIDRFRELLNQLLQKSIANDVRWRLLPTEPSEHEKQKFAVNFSNKSRIVLILYGYKPGPDAVMASLQVGTREIERIFADNYFEEFELLWSLLEEAERCTTRWDKTIDEIEQELAGDGAVGVLMDPVVS